MGRWALPLRGPRWPLLGGGTLPAAGRCHRGWRGRSHPRAPFTAGPRAPLTAGPWVPFTVGPSVPLTAGLPPAGTGRRRATSCGWARRRWRCCSRRSCAGGPVGEGLGRADSHGESGRVQGVPEAAKIAGHSSEEQKRSSCSDAAFLSQQSCLSGASRQMDGLRARGWLPDTVKRI